MILQPSRTPAVALALGAVVLAAVITLIGLIVLGLGPFGAPVEQPSAPPTAQQSTVPTVGPSPTPSTLQSQEPSPSVATAPSGSPALSLPPATPSSATDVLFAHVPETLRGTCTPESFDAPALALLTCTADEGAITVSYTLYGDQPSMAAVYDSTVLAAGIDDSSGRCYNRSDDGEITSTPSRWPAENGYTIQDEPAGRYLCHDDDTTATLTWTDDRLYVLGRASSSLASVDRLIAFWIDEAGPVP